MTDTFSPLDQLKHQAEIIKSDLSQQQNALEEGEIILRQSRENIEALKVRSQQYQEAISRLEAEQPQEPAAGPGIAGVDQTYYDDNTIWKVYSALQKAGFKQPDRVTAVLAMQNAGILFRERT